MDKIKIESKEELNELYEKYNTVMFTGSNDNDDIRKIHANMIAEIGEHLENYGFIFNEFILFADKYLYKVDVNHDNFNITLREKDEYGLIKCMYTYDINYYDYATANAIYILNKLDHKPYTTYKQIDELTIKKINVLITAIEVIVYFSIHPEIIIKDSSVKNDNSNSPKVKSTKTSSVIYKLTDAIRKYSIHMSKHKKHIITCEHWSVKGHYRHYKNGKVVWISPHERGKNKDTKIQNKVYKI